jgi:hypothetical protein
VRAAYREAGDPVKRQGDALLRRVFLPELLEPIRRQPMAGVKTGSTLPHLATINVRSTHAERAHIVRGARDVIMEEVLEHSHGDNKDERPFSRCLGARDLRGLPLAGASPGSAGRRHGAQDAARPPA